MNLALVGYGKMGRLLESLAPEYGFRVVLAVDAEQNPEGRGITAERLAGVDAAIEFTEPSAAVANLRALAAVKVATVCGTTGWYGELPAIRAMFEQAGAALVYAPNFSIGVNVFERVVAEAARWMAQQEAYGAWAWEIHHAAKKDAPSGTLLKLVESMRQAGFQRPVDTASNRAGAVPGTHEVGFDSAADTITLRHTARSREGFARGALTAARWAVGKTGCHEFSKILFGATERKE
jgi:4-hydroxy-tetrahydrodipicolinate reductase